MALEAEQAAYARELPNLLSEPGKFVLIKADKVIGTFEAYGDALKAGYEQFGLEPFLVKKIQEVEQIQCFSRDITPCRT